MFLKCTVMMNLIHIISQLTVHYVVDGCLNDFPLYFAITSKAAVNMLVCNFVCIYQSRFP